MAVIYLKDHAACVQANQWVEYREKINPFLLAVFFLLCTLYSIAVLEFTQVTWFIGFVVFLKVFCHFRIKHFRQMNQHGIRSND